MQDYCSVGQVGIIKFMTNIETFEKMMKNASAEKFNETISKGALQLEDDQIQAVSFVFWLVHMVEKDMGDVIEQAWNLAQSATPEVNQMAKQILQETILGKKERRNIDDSIADLPEEKRREIMDAVQDNYIEKRKIDLENLEYFSDKIKVFQAMFGNIDRTKLLWKLNDLRNEISHNRIDNLQYNGEDLTQRATKERLFLDYMKTALTTDFSKSDFWNSLNKEERQEIEKKYREIEDQI